ncbi:MAG: polymer-forming cytoskeletal protein [Patescibacteria group bacterium]|nr:polymer-forming cytoskeletal protein [Patescibacteria group bacterium]
MFNKEEQEFSPKGEETVIGPSVKVEGNFDSQGDIIVEGHVSGTIKTAGNLRVGQNAKIKADVEASNVNNAGEIRGNVKSSEKLSLSSSARVIGNVETGVLSVEEGAVLNGKCKMIKKEERETLKEDDENKKEEKKRSKK